MGIRQELLKKKKKRKPTKATLHLSKPTLHLSKDKELFRASDGKQRVDLWTSEPGNSNHAYQPNQLL